MEQDEFEEMESVSTRAIRLGRVQKLILRASMDEGPMRQRTLTEKVNELGDKERSEQTVRQSAIKLHKKEEVPFERKDNGNYIYYGISNMSAAKKMFGKTYD